jgi:hypothetical protein
MSTMPNATGRAPAVPIAKNDLLPGPQPRMLAIVAVAGIAVIHIAAAPDAQRAAPYLLGLYMALAAAAVPLIAVLLFSEWNRVWIATAAYALAPMAGYLWSRGIGLPGDSDDFGDWMNSLGIASLFVESLLVTVSLICLTRFPTRRREPVQRGPVPARCRGGGILSAAARALRRSPHQSQGAS